MDMFVHTYTNIWVHAYIHACMHTYICTPALCARLVPTLRTAARKCNPAEHVLVEKMHRIGPKEPQFLEPSMLNSEY